LLSAGVKDGGIEKGLDALVTEAERVARFGFTSTEMTRTKADILRAAESSYLERDKSNSSGYASELARYFLEDEPVPGVEEEYHLAQQLLPGITLEEVNRLARTWIVNRNRVLLANQPTKKDLPVPTSAQLLAVADGAAKKTIEPYKDMASDA